MAQATWPEVAKAPKAFATTVTSPVTSKKTAPKRLTAINAEAQATSQETAKGRTEGTEKEKDLGPAVTARTATESRSASSATKPAIYPNTARRAEKKMRDQAVGSALTVERWGIFLRTVIKEEGGRGMTEEIVRGVISAKKPDISLKTALLETSN